MGRRGQITIFIIIGIVMLIVFGFLFYAWVKYSSNATVEDMEKGTFGDEAISFTQTCISKTAMEGAYYIASRGGYDTMPASYLRVTSQGVGYEIGYGYEMENDKLISISTMEDQLEKYIEENLDRCTDGFQALKNQKITAGTPDAELSIEKDFFRLSVTYPLEMTQGSRTRDISEFKNIIIPIRLGRLHAIAEVLIQTAIDHPKRGPSLTYLAALETSNIKTYYGYSGKSLYYMMHDFDSSIDSGGSVGLPSITNRPFIFNMALRYG